MNGESIEDLIPIKVTCENCNLHKKLWSVPDQFLDEYQHLCYQCKNKKLKELNK